MKMMMAAIVVMATSGLCAGVQYQSPLKKIERLYDSNTDGPEQLAKMIFSDESMLTWGPKQMTIVRGVVDVWGGLYQDELRILDALEKEVGKKYKKRIAKLRNKLRVKDLQYKEVLRTANELNKKLLEMNFEVVIDGREKFLAD